MKLDRNECFAGQPIKRVRDWLRELRGDCARSAIVRHFGLEDPEPFLNELKSRQLLVDSAGWPNDDEPFYALGPLAARFAAAKLLRPISRQKRTNCSRDC